MDKKSIEFENSIYKSYVDRCSKEQKKEPIDRKEFDNVLDYVKKYLVTSKQISNEPYIDIYLDKYFILHAAIEKETVIMNVWSSIEYIHLTGRTLDVIH